MFSESNKKRAESLMLCFDKSKESPICLIILQQILVIVSTSTFYLSQNWRSDGHFEVLNIVGSKVMSQNATQAKKSRSLL